MNKEERIGRYGGAAYEKLLQQMRDWKAQWRKVNPDKAKANNQEIHRKGGKYYGQHLEYNRTGLQGERHKIRMKHWHIYHTIKQATPNSVIHHEWIQGTAEYRGVALVEEEAHQNGIIKVIKILEGDITVFTEGKLRGQNIL